jgi:hypothetical protein
MKQSLNEQFRRMQKLAGIITESQLNEAEEESIPTINSSDILKIQQSPEVKKLAAAISKDPKSIDKLNQIMKKAGVTLQEVEGVNIDAEDIKNIAAVIAPSLNEYEERAGAGDIVSAGFWLGAGATLIPGALEAVNNVLTLAPYNPAGGIAAMVAGALLGAVYALITGAE